MPASALIYLRLRLLQAADISDFPQTCQQDMLQHVPTCLGHVLPTQNCKLYKTCLLKTLPAKQITVRTQQQLCHLTKKDLEARTYNRSLSTTLCVEFA